MYSMQPLTVFIAACILVPVCATDLSSSPLTSTLAPVVIPPNYESDAVCPTNLERESARDNVSSSVRMLLQSLQLMTVEECGEGLWYRVAFLNMSDPTMECPDAWREYSDSENNVRVCGRSTSNSGSCSSTVYVLDNAQYSKVCGRITGYQFVTPDAFLTITQTLSIDEPYVDGVSVTHGNSRSHIWTFAASPSDSQTPSDTNVCPCSNTNANPSPSFVGNNYFCESGSNALNNFGPFMFFSEDPLWDGQGCPNSNDNCCSFNSPPWFSVDLGGPTTDDIEVRICGNEDTNNEDTPIELLELYIQ